MRRLARSLAKRLAVLGAAIVKAMANCTDTYDGIGFSEPLFPDVP